MKKCYLLCDAPEAKIILHMVRERLEKHGVVTIFGDYDEIEGTDEDCVAVLMTFSPEKGNCLKEKMAKAIRIGLLWEDDKAHCFDMVFKFPLSSNETGDRIAELCK